MGKLSNARHEKFAQNMAKGMTQRKAYKDAFPDSTNYSDKVIDNKASELFKTDEIKVRYNELLQELEDETIMTAKERMKWLTDVVAGKIKDVNKRETYVSDKMRAIDILNKMSGEYTTKIEGNVGITDIRVDIDE